jgi:hypothetical protein
MLLQYAAALPVIYFLPDILITQCISVTTKVAFHIIYCLKYTDNILFNQKLEKYIILSAFLKCLFMGRCSVYVY